MTTRSGIRVSASSGIPSLEDVAFALCRVPMYAGATDQFYSVAHHSINVALLMPVNSVYGLYHEAEVAVFGDCPGPVKVPAQRALEKEIRDRFIVSQGVTKPTEQIWQAVDLADQLDLAASARVLGLPDADTVWPEMQGLKRAIEVVKGTYAAYPPAQQLNYGSPLMNRFLELAYRLNKEAR